MHDIAPKGTTNPGDWVVGDDKLRNDVAQFGKPKGALVGSSHDVLYYRSTGITLTGTTKLPNGSIRTRSRIKLINNGNGYVVSVVGGTGRYASARGTLTVTKRSSDGKVSLNVFALTL